MTITELRDRMQELIDDETFDNDQPVFVAQHHDRPVCGPLLDVGIDDDGTVYVVSGEATEAAPGALWDDAY